MSDVDTKALRALLAKATPGEWSVAGQWDTCVSHEPGLHRETPCRRVAREPHLSDGEIRVLLPVGADAAGLDECLVAGMWDYEAGGIRRAEDAALIVAAVNALPALLNEVEALRALLATLRADLLDEANRRLGSAWGDAAGRRVALIDGTVWDADAFASGGADALRKSDAADR